MINYPETVQLEKAQDLLQTLNHNMVALTSLLQGRLSSAEKDVLAKVFETQVDLQLWLEQIAKHTSSPNEPGSDSDEDLSYFLYQLAGTLNNKAPTT